MSFDVQDENVLILPKCEMKYCELIKCFKTTVEMCFIDGFKENNIRDLHTAALEILKHGFTEILIEKNKCRPSTSNDAKKSENITNQQEFRIFQKLIDDFEWLRIIVNAQHNSKVVAPSSFVSLNGSITSQSFTSFLDWWLKITLKDRCLCACLELLLNDKDLLATYYNAGAFLRQDIYATAFLMGLSSWEQQQQHLLIQMEKLLRSDESMGMQNKRFNSQPDIMMRPLHSNLLNSKEKINLNIQKWTGGNLNKHFEIIRKTKSLTNLNNKYKIDFEFELQGVNSSNTVCPTHHRPRCKTFDANYYNTNKMKCPQFSQNVTPPFVIIATINTKNTTAATDLNRATSINYNNYGSSVTLNSSESDVLDEKVTSSSSSSRSSTASVSPHVHLINTDNIKIWTDVSWEQEKQKNQQTVTPSCAIPNVRNTQRSTERGRLNKSVSSINSFLSSLFGTPTTSVHTIEEETIGCCYCNGAEQQQNQSGNVSSANSLPDQSLGSTSISSSVFDTFMPVCGKKFYQKRYPIQRLFENGVSCLDYSTPMQPLRPVDAKTTNGNTEHLNSREVATKDCESLTKFLQTTHLMHNNTQLERENAHFRISEAIISAMEQIKWNSLMSDRKQQESATLVATDYLAKDKHGSSSSRRCPSTYCAELLEEEHTPIAELGEMCLDSPSAELIGLSLISKFNEEHLPKVSELKWLVSEEDAPQKLLPLPKIIHSTKTNNFTLHSITRGTQYWAPPRPQIIFTDHPYPNRKQLLQKQNYRCAGCGMRVSIQDINTFRYCTYFGKYHCTGCHRNHVSTIPAKILQTWDFKVYPVSVFAYRLLEEIYRFPLFYVPDVNPSLYIKINKLHKARHKRIRLKFVKDFISSCRFALDNGENYFVNVPDHITNDIENWSIADFTDTQSETLQKFIERLIEKCELHIYNCMLCTARGFFCELCQSDEIIFPWGINIMRCDQCGCCYHRTCWNRISKHCCRCERIDKRKSDGIDDIS